MRRAMRRDGLRRTLPSCCVRLDAGLAAALVSSVAAKMPREADCARRMIFRSRVGAFVPCDALGDTKRCGLPPHPVRPPVAFPEDGIRDQGKAVGTEAADGFAILVCPLSEAKWSEAKCPPAASHRPGLSRNSPLALSCGTKTGRRSRISISRMNPAGDQPPRLMQARIRIASTGIILAIGITNSFLTAILATVIIVR